MKKWNLMFAGAMLIAVTAQAKCDDCTSTDCAHETAATEMAQCAEGGSCPMEAAKATAKKHKGTGGCAEGDSCSSGGCKGNATAGTQSKKWYNPVSWFK